MTVSQTMLTLGPWAIGIPAILTIALLAYEQVRNRRRIPPYAELRLYFAREDGMPRWSTWSRRGGYRERWRRIYLNEYRRRSYLAYQSGLSRRQFYALEAAGINVEHFLGGADQRWKARVA